MSWTENGRMVLVDSGMTDYISGVRVSSIATTIAMEDDDPS